MADMWDNRVMLYKIGSPEKGALLVEGLWGWPGGKESLGCCLLILLCHSAYSKGSPSLAGNILWRSEFTASMYILLYNSCTWLSPQCTIIKVYENPLNISYGPNLLEPHMDIPMYESHPGLNFLQCICKNYSPYLCSILFNTWDGTGHISRDLHIKYLQSRCGKRIRLTNTESAVSANDVILLYLLWWIYTQKLQNLVWAKS